MSIQLAYLRGGLRRTSHKPQSRPSMKRKSKLTENQEAMLL